MNQNTSCCNLQHGLGDFNCSTSGELEVTLVYMLLCTKFPSTLFHPLQIGKSWREPHFKSGDVSLSLILHAQGVLCLSLEAFTLYS